MLTVNEASPFDEALSKIRVGAEISALATLGRRLSDMRRATGFTQRELAHSIGTTHQTLARYESGEIQPSALTVHAISQRLGVTVESLLSQPRRSMETPQFSAPQRSAAIQVFAASTMTAIKAR